MINSIISGLFTTTNLEIGGIVLGVIAIAVLGIYLVKKFGIKVFTTTSAIVNFVINTLDNLEFKNENISYVLDIIFQAVTYILLLNNDKTVDEKVSDSIIFIKNVITQDKINGINIVLTDGEIEVISTVLKYTFIFIETLNIKTKVTYKKLMKCAFKG